MLELDDLLKRKDIPKDAKNEIQRCIERIKKTEVKLKETEENYQNLILQSRKETDESRINYRMIVEKMQEGVLLEDLEGNIAFVNPRTAELLGYSEDELIGKHWTFIVPKEYFNQITVETAKRPEGVSSTYEASALARDGRHIPVIITATPIFNKSDEFKGVLSVFTDITKRKKAEEEVQESKERYQMLVEKLEEGVVLEDANGDLSFVNPRIVSMLGYTEDELLGKHWTNFAAEKYLDRVKEESAKRPKGISSKYEAKLLAKDGREISVIITAAPVFGKNKEFKGVLSVYVDITKRKVVEQKLRESEELYRSYVESARDLIFTISTEGIITSINPIFESLTGFVQDEWIGKPFSPLVYTDDFPVIIDGFKRVLEGERGVPPPEMRLLTKSGAYVTVEIKASPQVRDGKVTGMLGIARDITDRRRAEEALRESEEKYRTLVNNSLQGLVIIQGFPPKITFINPAMTEILGYSIDEMLDFKAKDIYNLVHSEDRESYFQRYQDRLDGKYIDHREIRAIRKDGSEVWMAAYTSSIDYLGKPAVQAAFIDISARIQAEETLRLVKVEEERFHAMLSHFLNNDLHKIINNLDFLTLEYEYGQVFREEIVKRITNIASRSSKTIDTVGKIFEVLQSPFDQQKKRLNVLNVIDKALSEISPFAHLIEFQREVLDVTISADEYLNVVFVELLSFILNSCTENLRLESKIIIEGSHLPSHFCVFIRDSCSEPISEEICSRLSGKITDEWEYQGHYIGISLATVIMQHYHGSLIIHPSDPIGNVFELHFHK